MSAPYTCLVALAIALPASVAAQGAGSPARAIAGITPASVRQHIGVLADDSLRGRATPSPGLDAAARYVANQLRGAGLRPLGGADLLVRWPLVSRHLVPSGVRLEAHDAGATVALRYGTDFAVLPAGDTRLSTGVVRMDSLTDSAAVRGRIPLVRLPAGRWAAPAHAAMEAARRIGAPALAAVVDSTQDIAAIAPSGASMD
ncbi:MAG: hypothetical protein ACREOQ_07595, partial [Gemmatimonadales bacterium]